MTVWRLLLHNNTLTGVEVSKSVSPIQPLTVCGVLITRFLSYVVLHAIVLTGGCSAPDTQADFQDLSETGARVDLDYYGDSDVVGFHFEIDAVACTPGADFEAFNYTANVDRHARAILD